MINFAWTNPGWPPWTLASPCRSEMWKWLWKILSESESFWESISLRRNIWIFVRKNLSGRLMNLNPSQNYTMLKRLFHLKRIPDKTIQRDFPTCQHHPWSSACLPMGRWHRWLREALCDKLFVNRLSFEFKVQSTSVNKVDLLSSENQPMTFQSVSPSSTMARIPSTFTSNTSPLHDKSECFLSIPSKNTKLESSNLLATLWPISQMSTGSLSPWKVEKFRLFTHPLGSGEKGKIYLATCGSICVARVLPCLKRSKCQLKD